MKLLYIYFPYVMFTLNIIMSIYIVNCSKDEKINLRKFLFIIATILLPIVYFLHPYLLFNYSNYVLTDMVFKSAILLLCIYIFLEYFILIKETRPNKCFSIPAAILFIFIISPIYWCHEGWEYHCQFIWSSIHLH